MLPKVARLVIFHSVITLLVAAAAAAAVVVVAVRMILMLRKGMLLVGGGGDDVNDVVIQGENGNRDIMEEELRNLENVNISIS